MTSVSRLDFSEVNEKETVRAHMRLALLETPAASSHVAQFYDNDEFLLESVVHFLGAGVQGGDPVVAVATPAHRAEILRRFEGTVGVEAAIAGGQLVLLDARETLSRFMVDGMPNSELFRVWVQGAIARMSAVLRPGGRIRVFGEMVDLLWRDGNSMAAIRLEELWNEAGEVHCFALLCAYVMGNFYQERHHGDFIDVCGKHSHVMPTEGFPWLEDSSARMREISVLQHRARVLESELKHRKELENALRDALSERSRAEEELRTSIAREREARERAEASDAFKEIFLGILGHDLRNPLNTVLTTARLMIMRGELGPESRKRIDRVISSGVRMQRMIEQLLDLTGARLGGGMVITKEKQDLVPLVVRIVDEVRIASPSVDIDLELPGGPCEAYVDGDRFEQVVSNLLGNAVSHGDATRPVRVAMSACANVAKVSVHNFGKPIEPAFMPLLFDPFKRGAKPEGKSRGLGLGLYIAERIMNAHEGKIEVESCQETGTRFEAILPRNG